MLRPLRWITVVALLLCLPLQGLAAVAMPIGMAHDEARAMSIHAMEESADHCHQLDAGAQPENSGTVNCDKCFSCHLNVAQAIAPFASDFQRLPAAIEAAVASLNKLSTLSFPFFRPPIFA